MDSGSNVVEMQIRVVDARSYAVCKVTANLSGLDYRDLLPSKMQPQRQNDVHLHFHSPDAKGVRRLFMDNAQHVRAALNSSYATYSGGADAGF